MFEFAHSYPWLIPALPLAACVLIGLTGKWLKGWAHVPAWLAMIFAFALSICLLLDINANPDRALHNVTVFTIDWFGGNSGGLQFPFHVPVAVTVDQLTALYLSFITGIGMLIFIYAAAYMKGDYGYWRFFAYLSIFVFFMCCLVMGSNLILIYLGWEGVGLASYLLIGYYYPRPSAVAAAKKAFITNRVGDFGLAIGVFLLYTYVGSVSFKDLFDNPETLKSALAAHPVLHWVPFCLMLGAFGKSAQFPLHVWLPDAMEGPTPVSALIHAATMVTAGIYLIARTLPLFFAFDFPVGDPWHHAALTTVACVGAFTAFMAASIAFCQYDLKRIWAYSTLSQLGYMFLGLGMATATETAPAESAVFHVFTHAFFKALLFLSAGSVMHAMGGELDIRKMSGIRKVMPITHITMLIGCLALAGFPGLAGFFSKDEIIEHAINTHIDGAWFLGVVGLVVALMTAFYTFRLYFKVFWGPLELPATAGHHEPSPFALDDSHGHGHDAHGVNTVHAKQGHEEASHGADSHGHAAGHGHDGHAHGPNDGSPLLWLPLLVLCIGAIGAGYLGWHHHSDWIHPFLGKAIGGHETVVHHEGAAVAEGAGAAAEHPRVPESALFALACVLPVLGIAGAWYFYAKNRAATAALAARMPAVVKFLNNKWYFDEAYSILFLKPLWILAHTLAYFDRYVIDGLVFIVSFIPQLLGYTLKPTQRGMLQRYAVGMIAGLAAVVLAVLYLIR